MWFVKDGKKTLVDSGLKFATGLAYRPDQWLLSVADGHSKWAYSYQINADGTLTNKERFFWLHVPDWEDDAGAESVCYAKEGQMFVATRWGIQVCADDGPTQVILPMPDRSRVIGVCLGRAGHGHAFRLLRRQDLETQGESPRHGRFYSLDDESMRLRYDRVMPAIGVTVHRALTRPCRLASCWSGTAKRAGPPC